METKNEKPLPELYMLLGNIFFETFGFSCVQFNSVAMHTHTHILIRIILM